MSPLIIAHRGLSSRAPENTLAAFEAAQRAGVRWIEADADIIGDGTPVVMHDSRTDRTTDVSASIYELSRADLESIDAGSWFDAAHAAERIPTVRQLVDFVNDKAMNLNLELKANEQGAARSLLLVEAVLAELQRTEAAVQVIVSSFSPLLLAELQRRRCTVPLALIVAGDDVPRDWLAQMQLCGATAIHPEARMVTESFVALARAEGYLVNPWTVNTRTEAERLMRWGCTGIITDVADELNDIG
jgi:glycerophosphoryl diester phosphodiesterase